MWHEATASWMTNEWGWGVGLLLFILIFIGAVLLIRSARSGDLPTNSSAASKPASPPKASENDRPGDDG